MYAVVEIAGQQFKVEKDQKVYVNRLEGKEGSKISFDNILILSDRSASWSLFGLFRRPICVSA